MEGKICLITGSSDGIGRAAALELARRGAKVILHGRSAEKGQRTVELIREATGSAPRFVQADFAELAQVRSLVDALLTTESHLDVLVNNAGRSASLRRERSADGYEMVFAVNHLASFLLTNLLMELLDRAPAARIVNVSSEAHRYGPAFDIDDLMSERVPAPFTYSHSKFANILFSNELARRKRGTSVTSNAMHPGLIRSGFAREVAVARILYAIASPFLKTAEHGARTVVHLAAHPGLEGATGGYYVDCRLAEPHPRTRDPDLARRLWELSERLVGL